MSARLNGVCFSPAVERDALEIRCGFGNRRRIEDWLAFCDLAIISAGKIPEDIVTNEELMNALPVLFRTVRDKTLDEEGLEKLIKSIKRELR